jgi:hypothetical protein
MAAPERTDGTTGGDAAWRAWFSLRRKRCWAWVLILAYALAGFVVAQWILARELPEWLSGRLQRPVELADLKINPFVLSVEATGFAIREPDGAAIVSFDRLFGNLQLASVWRRALVLRDFTLEQPFVNVIRAESGAFNVIALADSWNATASAEPAAPDETGDGGLFRAVVQNLELLGGEVGFTDRTLETQFQTRFGPVEFKLENLSTLPEDAGRQQVSITTALGARVQWSGDIQLQPLYSAGRVTGSGPYLPALYQYFQDQLAFEVTEGNVELSFDYRVELPASGTLSVALDDVLMDLRGLTMRRDGEDTPFLELPQLELSGGASPGPNRSSPSSFLR